MASCGAEPVPQTSYDLNFQVIDDRGQSLAGMPLRVGVTELGRSDAEGRLSVQVNATEGERYEGRDTGVKAYFEARAKKVAKSWHGEYVHTVDVENGRVATRFAVRRTDEGKAERTGDNINLFQFDGRLIRRVSVWRSPPLRRS